MSRILYRRGTGVQTQPYWRLSLEDSLALGWRVQHRALCQPRVVTVFLGFLTLTIQGTVTEDELFEAAELEGVLAALRCPQCDCTTSEDDVNLRTVCESCGWTSSDEMEDIDPD